jgi:hypothetical protein
LRHGRVFHQNHVRLRALVGLDLIDNAAEVLPRGAAIH